MTVSNVGPSSFTTTQLSAGGFGTAAGQFFAGKVTPLGAPASGAATANNIYVVQVDIPWPVTLTGILYNVGGTSSGNVRSALYDASGNRLAQATADSAQPAANQLHKVPFSATYAAAAGSYFAALCFSSATGTFIQGSQMGAATTYGTSYPPPATITPAPFPASGILLFVPYMAAY